VRRDGQDLRREGRGQDLVRGQADWELPRDRESRRPECGRLRGQDSGAEASVTRR